mgnify:CR=1 FL=1
MASPDQPTKVQPPPRRSILFLAVTAEEQGLLGSQYYAVTPIYPLARTLANINIDGLNVHGRTKDLTLIGLGASELDDYTTAAAREQAGRLAQEFEAMLMTQMLQGLRRSMLSA